MTETTDLNDVIAAALLTVVQRRHPDAEVVTNWEESFSTIGCDTCDYGAGAEVSVYFMDGQGAPRVFVHDGGFAALLAEATR